MTDIRMFRGLVLLGFASYLLWFFMPWIHVPQSTELQTILGLDGTGAVASLHHPSIFITFFVARAVAAIGLFFLLSWGRWLLLAYLACGMLFILFRGIVVETSVDVFFGTLSAIFEGVTLGRAFSFPMASYFRREIEN